jgi:hypothetical protein
MFSNKPVIDSRTAMRRKLLGSLIAGGGSLLLAACGGGSESTDPTAVANRFRIKHGNAGSAASAPSATNAAASSTATSTPTVGQTTIGAAAQQMKMPHEARPYGIAHSAQFPWADAPMVYNATPPAGMNAMIGFGDIHLASGAPTPLAGDTAQIRNFKTYLLMASGELQLVQNPTTLTGAQYYPDYSNDTNFPAQMTNSNGVTSVVLAPDRTFHFFPESRVQIDAPNVKGVVVTMEAKVSSPTGSTDPNINKTYLMGVGADWWTNVNAQWDNQTTNPGVGDGRYVFMTTDWQGFSFTSILNPSATVASIAVAY